MYQPIGMWPKSSGHTILAPRKMHNLRKAGGTSVAVLSSRSKSIPSSSAKSLKGSPAAIEWMAKTPTPWGDGRSMKENSSIAAHPLAVKLHLRFFFGSRIEKISVRCFRLAFNAPHTRIRQIVRFVFERRDETWVEPLDAIIRLSAEIAVVERNHMRAFVSALAGILGILAVVPVEREHILAADPGAVLHLHPGAALFQPVKCVAGDVVRKTIPKLEKV